MIGEPFKISRRPSTQDVSWFLDMYAVGQLELNPPYQRRSVWGNKDRKFFLDTVFRGFPCPPIYLHKVIRDGKSVYAVVDGKQRIETVLQFNANRLALPKSFGDTRLDGQKWKSVAQQTDLSARFLNYVFPVEFVELPFNDTAYVNDVFDRLNRNSKILNKQELRHAKYEGWMISRAETEVGAAIWSQLKVVTKARSRRMLDVQFISELMSVLILRRITGFDQELIDQLYAAYDDLSDFDDENEWHLQAFDEDEFEEHIAQARDDLASLVTDESIKDFLSDTKHLYSVWAYIVLSQYDESLAKINVDKLRHLVGECRTRALGPEAAGYDECSIDAIHYYDASVGANTELPQRNARHAALVSIMKA